MITAEQIKNEIAKRNKIQPDADEASIPCSLFQIETVDRELSCEDKFRARTHEQDYPFATYHDTIKEAQQDCEKSLGLPEIYWMESRSMMFGYVWENTCTGSLLLNLPKSKTGVWKLKFEIHRISGMNDQEQSRLR